MLLEGEKSQEWLTTIDYHRRDPVDPFVSCVYILKVFVNLVVIIDKVEF